MRIFKNVIEVQPDDNAKSLYIHRDNIAGLRSYKNHPINDKGEYILIIYLKHPINDREDFVVGCNDVEKYIEWFDDDEREEIQKFFENTLEKNKHTAHKLEPRFPDPSPLGETLVDLLYAKPTPETETPPKPIMIYNTCMCCNEQMLSVKERPEFNNELLCTLCTFAKRRLASLDNETTTIVKEEV